MRTEKKKGMTLIELMVAMTIFSVILLVAVGAFISMNNLRAVALNAKESQQKLRMAIEMISRYSRQAEKIIMSGENDANYGYSDVEMFFNLGKPTSYGEKFSVDRTSGNQALLYYECTPLNALYECTNGWGTPTNLLGGDVKLDAKSGFKKNEVVTLNDSSVKVVAVPPSLSIKLIGAINNVNQFYKNDFDIDTRVILESIK